MTYPSTPEERELSRLPAFEYFGVAPDARIDSDEWMAIADHNARKARVYDEMAGLDTSRDWPKYAGWMRERARKAREAAALEEKAQTEYEAETGRGLGR